MAGLFVLFLLWLIVTIGTWVHPKLGRSTKVAILAPLLVYGAISCASLVQSYARGRAHFQGVRERIAIANEHLSFALDGTPDSVLSKPVVQSARRLHATIARTQRFGIWSWGVEYRYGVIPRLDGQVLAANLLKLADVPAQLVYSASARARLGAEFTHCYEYRRDITHEFPMDFSRTVEVISMVFNAFDEGSKLGSGLADTLNIAKDDVRDPRSISYKLVATATRLVGIQNKLDELVGVGCDAFDDQLTLAVRNVRMASGQDAAEWMPLSAVFMDFTPLVPVLSGINTLEVRWMGHPPTPVVGTMDPVYRLDCSATGAWPAGQSTWTDSAGNKGPSYFVDPAASRVFAQGVELCKWPRQPDVRSLNIRADREDRRYAGLPTVDVSPEILLPPGQKRPR